MHADHADKQHKHTYTLTQEVIKAELNACLMYFVDHLFAFLHYNPLKNI